MIPIRSLSVVFSSAVTVSFRSEEVLEPLVLDAFSQGALDFAVHEDHE